jgi:hypothetical protein
VLLDDDTDRRDAHEGPPIMRTSTLTLATIALAAAALAAPASAGTAPAARVQLEPARPSVGEAAQLTVSFDGDAATQPEIRIAGARVGFTGQMSRTSIINGAAKTESSFVYTVVPDRAGPLDIPAISVTTSVGMAISAPIRTTVTDAPAAATHGAAAAPAAPATAEPTRAFIKLELPAKSLVVGQAVPVKIRAYFRAGTAASTQGQPTLTSNAFTLSDVSDKPAQTQVQLHGTPYLQATWTAMISPAKPLTGKVGVELPVEIAYREPRAVRRRSLRDMLGSDPFGGDPFAGDPFFDQDAFAGIEEMLDVGPVKRRSLTLRADAGTLTVSEPPQAGRPAGFGGAVGTFALAMDPPKADDLRVGEPMTVTFRVTGTGNFDRVALAGIPDSQELKAYATKSELALKGTSPLTGTKTFTQTVVPTRAGTLELPPINFSYWNPATKAYVTAKTDVVALQIAGARAGGSVDGSLASTSVRDPAMAPNRLERGATASTLAPAFRQRGFWRLPGAIALVTLLGVGAAWWRRSPRIAARLSKRRVDRAVASARSAMERAARAKDPTLFFTAARAAFQARLGAGWGVLPEAVTAADVTAHLGPRGDAIRSVFERADSVTYARDVSTEPLDHWRTVVRTELSNLEVAR